MLTGISVALLCSGANRLLAQTATITPTEDTTLDARQVSSFSVLDDQQIFFIGQFERKKSFENFIIQSLSHFNGTHIESRMLEAVSRTPLSAAGIKVTSIVKQGEYMLIGAYTTTLTSNKALILRVTDSELGIELDPAFGENGILRVGFSEKEENADETLRMITLDGDKVLASGSVAPIKNSLEGKKLAIARFNEDGSPDTSFSGSGKISYLPPDVQKEGSEAYAVVRINNAYYAAIRYGRDFGLIKYHVNGQLDQSFGDAGVVSAAMSEPDSLFVELSLLQVNDKIVVAGRNFYAPSEENGISLLAVNKDGTYDNDFGDSGRISQFSFSEGSEAVLAHQSLALTPNGIILAGTVIQNGRSDFSVARFYFDGQLDDSFGDNGIARIDFSNNDDRLMSLHVYGRQLLLTGPTHDRTHLKDDTAIVWLNQQGKPDACMINPLYGSLVDFNYNNQTMVLSGEVSDSNIPSTLSISRQPAGEIWHYHQILGGFVELVCPLSGEYSISLNQCGALVDQVNVSVEYDEDQLTERQQLLEELECICEEINELAESDHVLLNEKNEIDRQLESITGDESLNLHTRLVMIRAERDTITNNRFSLLNDKRRYEAQFIELSNASDRQLIIDSIESLSLQIVILNHRDDRLADERQLIINQLETATEDNSSKLYARRLDIKAERNKIKELKSKLTSEKNEYDRQLNQLYMK